MEQRIRQTLATKFDAEVAEHARLENLGGHASLRIYWRITLPTSLDPPRVYPRGESTLMAMVLPEGVDPFESAEGLSDDAPNPQRMPFVDVQRYLADIGMPVPSIDTVEMEQGVLLLEDLGDELFEDAVLNADSTDTVVELYREAIDLLIRFQSATNRQGGQSPDCIAFSRRFDAELLRWELAHYTEWGLEERLGSDVVAPVREQLTNCFDRLVTELVDLPQTLVLRDYQSRNIMHKRNTWVLIDFQDALVGPFIYDLVALLRDSYIELSADTVETLVDYYADRGAAEELAWCSDADAVHRAFHLQTVQRKLKDAGRFIFIDREKGNPDFLDYYEPSIQYVRHSLERLDGFETLQRLLAEVETAW